MYILIIKVGYVFIVLIKRLFVFRLFVFRLFVLVGKKGFGNVISVVVVFLYNIKLL